MAQDFGIIISQSGTAVNGAAANQIIMNTSNPFIKLDTQNPQAFQTITLLIVTDPPNAPSAFVDSYTVLYKFKHTYTYIPSLETLFYLVSPPPSALGYQTYAQDTIFLGGPDLTGSATVYAIADTTWIYIICDKTGVATLLTGTTIAITPHVFVDGVLD
jgi:hypothetical protein